MLKKYQDLSMSKLREIHTGSNPVLTTLIKLVYEQPLRWGALIITEVRWRNWIDATLFGER